MKLTIFNILAVLIMMGFTAGCKPSEAELLVIHSSNYDFKNAKDATPVMLRMLADAQNDNNSQIVIEKGTYHFYPEKAFEKYCFITNHDDGLRSTPFPLINMRNLEIVADSAEFIFHGPMVPFIIEGSQNIKLSGFSIDWELPLHSEVEVISINKKEHTFNVKVDCPYEIRNGELIFLKEGYEHTLGASEIWDPATGAVAYDTWLKYAMHTRRNLSTMRYADRIKSPYEQDPKMPVNKIRGRELSLRAKEITPGIVKITGHHAELPTPGWIIVSKGETGLQRVAPAIRVNGCKDVSIMNVTVHHAGGMGIVCEYTENISLDNFNVALKPGSGRFLTTTADATHFNNCRGLVEMKNCLFENMLDDGTNVHGSYVKIADVIDERTLGIHIGHFQQMGMTFVRPGDQCGFVKVGIQYAPYFTSRVTNVQRLNKRYYLLSFEDNLEGVAEGDLLESIDWYPRVHVSGCTVRNNRARGFAFATPHEVICENNYFSNMMSAILLPCGFANYWYESGRVKNCIIRNNTFGDCGYGGDGGGVRSHALIQGAANNIAENEPYPLGTVIIENNIFQTFNSFLFNHGGIENFVFRNNSLELTDNYPRANADKPVIQLGDVKSKTIEGNQIPEGLLLVNADN